MLGDYLYEILITFPILLFSLTVHEAAHAWSADQLGDSTARLLGRVSLNPIVHIDLIGTIIFPLIAMVGAVPIIGWAKPVPVNTLRLRHWRRDFAAIAAAGPASNLLLALVAGLLLRFLGPMLPGLGVVLLQTAVVVNVSLALFNMVPVPPLDGGNVLAGLLRGPAANVFDRIRPFGFVLLYGLMFSGILSAVIGPPARWLLSWLL